MKPTEQYIEKASALPDEVAKQLLLSGRTRFSSDPTYLPLQPNEKVAAQLQFEDEALQEWQTKVAQLRQLDAAGARHP